MDLKNQFAFCQYFMSRQRKTKKERGLIRKKPRRPIKRIFLKHAAAS